LFFSFSYSFFVVNVVFKSPSTGTNETSERFVTTWCLIFVQSYEKTSKAPNKNAIILAKNFLSKKGK